MEHTYIVITLRLILALLAGAVIGFERSYHGRPAGLRTHTLVAAASALLMLLTVYQWELLKDVPLETVRVDPTRMGQGIMTGIGFLGAGAIMKEKLTVRGLTTAASIWMTAAIGIMIGMGAYFASAMAVFLSLVTLSLLRLLEERTPTLNYARLTLRCTGSETMPREKLQALLKNRDISGANISYALQENRRFQYQLTIRAREAGNFELLAQDLMNTSCIDTFSIRPASN
ncbi:MAG: MgtC/SapB family protein [Thiogranum sp.]|nr:MgtC/SapB family protein [Thiogranum sp.]